MKRTIFSVLALCMLLCSIPRGSASGISAESYVLMEAGSGQILAERNAHLRRPIASITKLMTALTALESGKALSEEYKIAGEWTGAEGSSIYLKPDERVSLETLLYGMLLRSGNDAALAVAGICGGTVEEFVVRMNCKAKELCMVDSHFENPNGLHHEGHYSSAYDMALLARACLKNEDLAEIVSTRFITMGTRSFTNHNKLLWRYPGCIGMKTGYTESAGRTLVSAAERDGVTLICVTLNAPDDWSDHTKLLDEGFSYCRKECLIKSGTPVCRIPVRGSLLPFVTVSAASDVEAVVMDGERAEEKRILTDQVLYAPARAGTAVGKIFYQVNGRTLGQTDLVLSGPAPCDVAEPFLKGLPLYRK